MRVIISFSPPPLIAPPLWKYVGGIFLLGKCMIVISDCILAVLRIYRIVKLAVSLLRQLENSKFVTTSDNRGNAKHL